jgi:hypothetical protein
MHWVACCSVNSACCWSCIHPHPHQHRAAWQRTPPPPRPSPSRRQVSVTSVPVASILTSVKATSSWSAPLTGTTGNSSAARERIPVRQAPATSTAPLVSTLRVCVRVCVCVCVCVCVGGWVWVGGRGGACGWEVWWQGV